MSRYLQLFPQRNKSEGFSLIEILVVTAISTIIFAALFMVLNTGEFSNSVGSASLDLHQQVRKAMDQLIRDLRQTAGSQMSVINASGGPEMYNNIGIGNTFSDPQFPLCAGYNVGASAIIWGDTIAYTYNPAAERLIRTNLVTNQQFFYNYITNVVFTYLDLRQMRIDITGQRFVKRGLTGDTVRNLVLSEEVRFRNE